MQALDLVFVHLLSISQTPSSSLFAALSGAHLNVMSRFTVCGKETSHQNSGTHLQLDRHVHGSLASWDTRSGLHWLDWL